MSCPACFKGSAKDGTPAGKITTLHGRTVYIASPPTITSPSTILYLPDAFGYTFVNNQLLADTYAARTGMPVLVPDVIPGTAMSTAILPLMDAAFEPVKLWDILGQLKRVITIARVLLIGIPFMLRSKAAKALPTILDFARAVKKDLPAGGKLGVCGFCWGGKPSTALCAETAEPDSEERLIDAQFCAHPSAVDIPKAIVDAITTFNVPYSMAAAENDMVLPLKQLDELEAALREKAGRGDGENGYHFEIVRYPNCAHGFAVRAKPEDEVEMEAAGKACEQAIAWFTRWL
jgi:dienelactone hydrolase